jgi:hypothetical protein
MAAEAAATNTRTLVLKEKPQPHQGQQKGERLRYAWAHIATLRAPARRGNRKSEASETESGSAIASCSCRLSEMNVVGVDGSESARDALASARAAEKAA